MAESHNHMNYVRKIVEYVKDIPTDFISRYLLVDLPDFPERPTPTLDGYIPDVLYKDTNIIIIGEAKTIRDVENDHTERQINSYIEEVRCHKGTRHIVICSNALSFSHIKNMIVRKKNRENISDISFQILDNIYKVAVIWAI